MELPLYVYLLLAFLLLLLNAFFVLAEFAAVKMRATRIEELVDQGNPRAKLVQNIQAHLDEYLSVCQVGITFSSIGLGFVGEPAFARMLEPILGSWAWAHAVAITMAYVVVSYLHILLGELIPKSLAIRRTEGAVLMTAMPLRFFRTIFYVPLVVLNGSANFLLRLFGVTARLRDARHTEDELKIILARSQTMGMMSFRRLLLLENVFDLGDLTVRDAMRSRDDVKVLQADGSWEDNRKIIRQFRLSRYPLVDGKAALPLGVIHVKDLLYEEPDRLATVDLKSLARPITTTREDTPLESLLANLQRNRGHLAIVLDRKGNWTGFITLEDIIEEIIGTVEDEFEVEPPLTLADSLTAGRVVLDIQASSIEDAIQKTILSVPAGELPLPPGKIAHAIIERERAMTTYLGRGLATPHARMAGLEKPVVLFSRSEEGIPVPGRDEKVHLLFTLLTPARSPRVQARLLARIGGLMDSEFVEDRLREAKTIQEVLEAVRAGDPVALS